jgi:hypothetical protein
LLTGDDSLIGLIGSRLFAHLLHDARLTVALAQSVAQARELGHLPLVIAADMADFAAGLAARRRGGLVVVGSGLDGDGVRWVSSPQSPEGWADLLSLATVQSSFASTSQMLAMRNKAAA